MPAKRGTTIPESGWYASRRFARPASATGVVGFRGHGHRLVPSGQWIARAKTRSTRSMPQSISSRVMVRGGAKRRTVPCVSFERTPSATSASQTVRAETTAGSTSTPTQSPLPRTSGDDVAAHRAKAILHVVAHFGTALDESLLLDDRKGLEADPRRERVAAEGRAVRAGIEDAHELARRDEGRDRVDAAAEGLAEDQPVGPDALVLMREPAAGAPEAGLDLIEDQQHAALVADRAKLAQIALRRHDDAGLALNRLDEDRRRYSA